MCQLFLLFCTFLFHLIFLFHLFFLLHLLSVYLFSCPRPGFTLVALISFTLSASSCTFLNSSTFFYFSSFVRAAFSLSPFDDSFSPFLVFSSSTTGNIVKLRSSKSSFQYSLIIF